MKTSAGVWIDHRKARIVALTPDGHLLTEIFSNVEKHPQRRSDVPTHGPFEAQLVPADNKQQRVLTDALNRYYDSVIEALRNYTNLLVIGPGEAGGELQARLRQDGQGNRIAAVETVGRITDRQLIAKVCAYFDAAAPRRQPPLQ